MWRSRILRVVVGLAAGSSSILRSEDLPADHVVRLPPFLVEVESLEKGPRWLYGGVPGLEILSAGEEDETQAFIQDLRRQRIYLGRFIPDEFLCQTALPTTLILFPRSLAVNSDEEMIRELGEVSAGSAESSRFEPMSDLRLSDPDSTYIFVVLKDWQWRSNQLQGRRGPQIVCSPAYLRFLLESRVPALPAWFSVGVSKLYGSSLFSGLMSGPRLPTILRAVAKSPPKDEIDEFEPDPWLSEEAAKVLRADGRAPRPLLPMRELFGPLNPVDRSEEYRRVWEAQSELFVRWAFSGNVSGGRDRLRRFAAAAATQPITQEFFRACFALSYADARDALSDYLSQAVKEPLKVSYAPIAMPQPIELREAKPEEIHRINGEWARRSLRVIRENYPKALPLYIEKTRRSLQHAYDRGERDPQLLASLGLFRIDSGDATGGREILEKHLEAAGARPLAGLALAQFHLQDALQKPAGLNGNLSEEQAAQILGEVSATLKQTPPIENAYLLAARVLQHLGREPTDRERRASAKGRVSFPEIRSWPSNALRGTSARGTCPGRAPSSDWRSGRHPILRPGRSSQSWRAWPQRHRYHPIRSAPTDSSRPGGAA